METFFSTSEKIKHIIKNFNLTKTLYVSSIIIGDAHTGKKSLARSLFPDAPLVSGTNQKEVELALKSYDELIITDFEKLVNQSILDFTNKRIIATANYIGNANIIDDTFAFIYTMPSLEERPEDVQYLKEIYINEASKTLMLKTDTLSMENITLSLKKNTKSLKKSIYTHIMKQSIQASDIEDILFNYLLKHLDGNDVYKKYLSLYERPLIEAGLQKFGSQLQLSSVLGINRNTLRKKIHEHHID